MFCLMQNYGEKGDRPAVLVLPGTEGFLEMWHLQGQTQEGPRQRGLVGHPEGRWHFSVCERPSPTTASDQAGRVCVLGGWMCVRVKD